MIMKLLLYCSLYAGVMDRETVIKEMLKLMTLFDNLHGDVSSKVMLETHYYFELLLL